MDIKFYWFALAILSVWRLTHLLNAEDGPWDLVVRLRRAAGSGFWAGLLDCFYCLSVWMAAPIAYLIGSSWVERLLLWPALSAGAILLERAVPEKNPAPPYLSQDQEDTYVLRQESPTVANADASSAPEERPGSTGS
jgi:hypothetical protein